METKLFISYHFEENEAFIVRVCYYLRKQGLSIFFHRDAPIRREVPGWRSVIQEELSSAGTILFFHGEHVGKVQKQELDEAKNNKKGIIIVKLPKIPDDSDLLEDAHQIIEFSQNKLPLTDTDAYQCAKECVRLLGNPWIVEDDIPEGYPFDYEKAIIDHFVKDKINIQLIAQGCPEKWPAVNRKEDEYLHPNPIPEEHAGRFRDDRTDNPVVYVSTISDFQPEELKNKGMVFPLAGPRKDIVRIEEGARLNIGILVSGGIAPGTNAVIAAIYKRHKMYAEYGKYNVRVCGFFDGFDGLLSDEPSQTLNEKFLEEQFNKGGSILGTSRVSEFNDPDPSVRDETLEDAVNRILVEKIKILYILGGDGSMRAAHVLHKRIQARKKDVTIVAIPKTMDNDVLWGWQTFGFESAVEKANGIIHQLHVEALSNPRLCVLQLFGSDSGHVVTHASLASGSGACDLFLIPEVPFTMRSVWKYVRKRLMDNYNNSIPPYRSHGLILMAETAIPLDARWYIEDESFCFPKEEVEAVNDYLKHEYWDSPPIGIKNNSVSNIRSYLGIDKKIPKEKIKSLSDEEKQHIRDYAEQLRTAGQTPDELRSAGLRIFTKVLKRRFKEDRQFRPRNYWNNFRIFTNEPRHLLRAVDPTSSDILFGQRLGTLSVDGAMAGYTDFMISQWLTEYVMVPLRLVILGRKRVPENGIFYRSAIASTGQPADLI
ncbi:6-phosphofructokinase [bacterium]|nr:6-phosphofructokinase [bacterium]